MKSGDDSILAASYSKWSRALQLDVNEVIDHQSLTSLVMFSMVYDVR